MKTLSNSELNKALGVSANTTKEVNFENVIIATMKPKFMKPYDIECLGVILREESNGKSIVDVKYRSKSGDNYLMSYTFFKAVDKKKIQEELLKGQTI